MFVTQRVVFLKRQLISKRVTGSCIDLDKIQKSTNEELEVGHSFQFEFEIVIEESDIPPTPPNRLDRRYHIPSHIDLVTSRQ